MYEKELYIRADNTLISQSYNNGLNETLPGEKSSTIRGRSGDSGRFNEKSFESKKSINILAATDGSRSITRTVTEGKAGFSKFKTNPMAGGLEAGLPSLNIPFKNNVLSNSQLNSFYRRQTMMKSFNRGNSLFTAFRDREDSPDKARNSASPARDFLRKKTVANDERFEHSVDVSSFKKPITPNKPEELNTAQVAENFMHKLTVSEKISVLNNKGYSFVPSKQQHGRR